MSEPRRGSAALAERPRPGLRSSGHLVLLFVGVVLTGCPERDASPADATAPCREVGQRCEVSPGKLGSCVLNDDCRGPNCFVCQSQH